MNISTPDGGPLIQKNSHGGMPGRFEAVALATMMLSCTRVPSRPPTQTTVLEADEVGSRPPAAPKRAGVDPVWDELSERFAELASMRATWARDPPAWLEEAERLWWSGPDGCHPAERTEEGHFRVHGCRREHTDHVVSCRQDLEIGARLVRSSLTFCEAIASTAGNGGSGFAMSAHDGIPDAPLIDISEDHIEYRQAWVVTTQPAQYVQVRQTCFDGGSRVCHQARGMILRRVPFGERDRSEFGVQVERAPDPVDCNLPCPDDSEQMRRYNEWAEGRIVVETDPSAALRFFRTREACEGQPVTPGLAIDACDTPRSLPGRG